MKKAIIAVLVAGIVITCQAENPDVLSRQIDWPARALRIDNLFETPTETVADKFSAFQETLYNEYKTTLHVFLSPNLAKREIKGWSDHEKMPRTALTL